VVVLLLFSTVLVSIFNTGGLSAISISLLSFGSSWREERLVLVGEQALDEPGGVSADLWLLFLEQEAEEAFDKVCVGG
jgi:hypothetical protein